MPYESRTKRMDALAGQIRCYLCKAMWNGERRDDDRCHCISCSGVVFEYIDTVGGQVWEEVVPLITKPRGRPKIKKELR